MGIYKGFVYVFLRGWKKTNFSPIFKGSAYLFSLILTLVSIMENFHTTRLFLPFLWITLPFVCIFVHSKTYYVTHMLTHNKWYKLNRRETPPFMVQDWKSNYPLFGKNNYINILYAVIV
jgi:hypothetical protein